MLYTQRLRHNYGINIKSLIYISFIFKYYIILKLKLFWGIKSCYEQIAFEYPVNIIINGEKKTTTAKGNYYTIITTNIKKKQYDYKIPQSCLIQTSFSFVLKLFFYQKLVLRDYDD